MAFGKKGSKKDRSRSRDAPRAWLDETAEQKLALITRTSAKKGELWQTRGSFAQGQRVIDVSKMGAINKNLWAKGLNIV